MTENESKLEQCRKDKAAIEKLEKELEEIVKRENNKKWLIAWTPHDGGRLLLNLEAISTYAKQNIAEAIVSPNKCWISIALDGGWGYSSKYHDGLTWYDNTEVIV